MQTETMTPATEITADARLVLEALTRLGGAAFDMALSAEAHVGGAYATALRFLVHANLVERVCVEPGSGSDLIIVADSHGAATKALALLAPHSRRRHLKPVRERLIALIADHTKKVREHLDALLVEQEATQRKLRDELDALERNLLRSALVLAQRVAPGMPSTARTTSVIDDYDPRFRMGVGRTEGGMIDGLVEVTIEIDRTAPLHERLARQSPQLRAVFRAASASPKTVGDAAEYAAAWADAVTLARIVVAASTVDG